MALKLTEPMLFIVQHVWLMWRIHFGNKIIKQRKEKEKVTKRFDESGVSKIEEFIRSNACATNWFHFAFDHSHQCNHYVWEWNVFTAFFSALSFTHFAFCSFIHKRCSYASATCIPYACTRVHTNTHKKCVSCTNSQIEKTCTQNLELSC